MNYNLAMCLFITEKVFPRYMNVVEYDASLLRESLGVESRKLSMRKGIYHSVLD